MFNIPTIHLVLLVAAAWRLSNLIAQKEEGPFRIIWKFHLWARRLNRKSPLFAKSHILTALECEYCLSVWFGTALTVGYFFMGDALLWIILPLVISTGVILIKHLVFLIKSLDTRFDQQNKAYLSGIEERAIAAAEWTRINYLEQNSKEGGKTL